MYVYLLLRPCQKERKYTLYERECTHFSAPQEKEYYFMTSHFLYSKFVVYVSGVVDYSAASRGEARHG